MYNQINSPVTSESSMLNARSTPIDDLQTKEITAEVETQFFFIHLLKGPPHKPKKFRSAQEPPKIAPKLLPPKGNLNGQLQILPLYKHQLNHGCFCCPCIVSVLNNGSPQPWHTFFLLQRMLLSGSSSSQFWCHKASSGRWRCFLWFPLSGQFVLVCRILYQIGVQQKHVLWCLSNNGCGQRVIEIKSHIPRCSIDLYQK